MGLLEKWPGPKHRVRLNQVSALEGVRLNQVLLYTGLMKSDWIPPETIFWPDRPF